MKPLSTLLFAASLLLVAPVVAKSATEDSEKSQVCAADRPIEERITACTKILSLDNLDVATRVNTLNLRGLAFLGRSQPVLAISDFEDAQKLHYYPNTAVMLSTLYVNIGRDSDAITEVTKLVNAGEANANIFNLLGAAYQNAGDFDASINSFNKALLLNPKFLTALNNRAAAYEKKGDLDKAGKDLDAVLAIDPNLPIALANRCGLFTKNGELDRGLPFCAKAEHLDPDNAIVIMGIGASYYEGARYDDALKYYERGVAMMPSNPRFIFMRGMAKAKLGHKEEAEADFSAATSIMPDVAAAMSKLGLK